MASTYSPTFTVLLVTLNYLINILSTGLIPVLGYVYAPSPIYFVSGLVLAVCGWMAYISFDGAEFRTGRPDKKFTQTHWLFMRLREYLSVKLHRTAECQAALLKANPKGQAIFSFFPHGVNSDFRVLMDGMMYDAFPATYEKGGPARTLAATVLFQIPGIRQLSLATACVDAGRKTATRCLKAGYSLMLCPGGQDEQLETIYGRERVYLKRRAGFIRLAIIHGVPVVPAYCFGSSDLYYTSRLLHGLRVWLVRNLRIALPLYSGGWGMFAYPTPKGMPLPVPQNIVFGPPLSFPQVAEPSPAEIEKAHDAFIEALVQLFDAHKDEFGCKGRKLEVL